MKQIPLLIALSSLAFLATTFSSTPDALALQHYQSRTGFYLQLGGFMGGGYNSVKKHSPLFPKDAGPRSIDFGATLGAGFGLFEFLTVGGEATWIGQPLQRKAPNKKNASLFSQNIDLLAALDCYVFSGVTLGIAGGVAINYTSVSSAQEFVNYFRDESRVGFGLKGSLGYEGFINGTLAIGGRFYYLRNFYSERDYDSFGALAYLRWY